MRLSRRPDLARIMRREAEMSTDECAMRYARGLAFTHRGNTIFHDVALFVRRSQGSSEPLPQPPLLRQSAGRGGSEGRAWVPSQILRNLSPNPLSSARAQEEGARLGCFHRSSKVAWGLVARALFGFVGLVLTASLSYASLQEPQQPLLKVGDAVVTGFGKWRVTSGANGTKHFVILASQSKKLHLDSKAKGLKADCSKAEGDVTANNQLETATMSGGVHVEISRPSSEKTSKIPQVAVADGETATYTEGTNKLHVSGGVTIHDDDPGADRSLNAVGTAADLLLSPQGSRGEALQSGTMSGPVKLIMKGLRTVAAVDGHAAAKAPFTINSKSDRASFDYVARTITLTGHVHMTSDDPSAPESYVSSEKIHLNQDGSIDSVEGEGDPGTTTIDIGNGGGK